ncbi:hypothetical protein [Kribbella deserti]|uniref:Uncharacterized protein n=1 Tax=Kribbella deserti TaxID=1926257 RepID=A0ABV6QG54_9ACTN
MNDEQRDDLRARLRAADPAHTPSGANSWIDNLVEATVSTDVAKRTTGRRWIIAAAAAVALLAIAGFGGFAVLSNKEPVFVSKSTLALTVAPADAAASCMVRDVNILAQGELALDATAIEVGANKVTLQVGRWYKGGNADLVEVISATGSETINNAGVVFNPGERYLITASGGVVRNCDLSAAWTPELAAMYERAF